MPDYLRWNSFILVCGKIIFHETSPWCQKCWGTADLENPYQSSWEICIWLEISFQTKHSDGRREAFQLMNNVKNAEERKTRICT